MKCLFLWRVKQSQKVLIEDLQIETVGGGTKRITEILPAEGLKRGTSGGSRGVVATKIEETWSIAPEQEDLNEEEVKSDFFWHLFWSQSTVAAWLFAEVALRGAMSVEVTAH